VTRYEYGICNDAAISAAEANQALHESRSPDFAQEPRARRVSMRADKNANITNEKAARLLPIRFAR
jgi:hypothetical protein